MNSQFRAHGLDGLRGLAAAAVVLLHVWMFGGAHDPAQPVLLDQIVGSMGLALMMFFVLSGYLVAAPWIRAGVEGTPAPDLWRYAVKRAARILPAYWLVLVASYVVMQEVRHPLAVELSELPMFALFLQNQAQATAGQLNPPLWSLGIEVAFYVVLPVIGVALIAAIRRFGQRGALLVAGAMTAAGLLWGAGVQLTGADPLLVASLPTYLPIFACGIAAAALVHGRTRIALPARVALIAAGSLLVYLDGWWHVEATGFAGHVVRNLPAGAGFAMIAVAVAHAPARVLGSLPLRRLGDYSYGIYLWHMPVLYVVRYQDRWPESPWTAFAVVFGISTLLGAASWHLFERHVVTWTTKWLRSSGGRRGAAPAATPAGTPVGAGGLLGSLPQLGAAATPAASATQHRRRGPSHGHGVRTHLSWAHPHPRTGAPVVRVRRIARAHSDA